MISTNSHDYENAEHKISFELLQFHCITRKVLVAFTNHINYAERCIIEKHLLASDLIPQRILSYLLHRNQMHHIPEVIFALYKICLFEMRIHKVPGVRILFVLNFIIEVLVSMDVPPFSNEDENINVIENSLYLLETKIDVPSSHLWWLNC